MAINNNTKTRSPYTVGNEPAWDGEAVGALATDYTPTDDAGNPVTARGFIICTNTGAVKIKTAAGHDLTIPTGLATGLEHAIAFQKIYSGTTTATGLIALT